MHSSKPWSKTTEPTSYEQIYRFVELNLDECSTTIDELEKDYYQGTTGSLSVTSKDTLTTQSLAISTLLAWSRCLNELRHARSLHDIRNGKTMRDLLSDIKASSMTTSVSDESVFLIKRILDQTSEQLYSKMPLLATRIDECMALMGQYFLSFYDKGNVHDPIQKKNKKKEEASVCRPYRLDRRNLIRSTTNERDGVFECNVCTDYRLCVCVTHMQIITRRRSD
jgi:hypothetical protein